MPCSAVVPSDGEYTVRVYPMRSAAPRNESAPYTLTVEVTLRGGAAAPSSLGQAPADDAKVRVTRHHGTGPLPCAMGNAPIGPTQREFGFILASWAMPSCTSSPRAPFLA